MARMLQTAILFMGELKSLRSLIDLLLTMVPDYNTLFSNFAQPYL